MQMYYAMLILGLVLLFIGVFWFIFMCKEKEFTIYNIFKSLLSIILGGLLLVITLPSLKYMIFKEYDVVKGSCTIEKIHLGDPTKHHLNCPIRTLYFILEIFLTWIPMEGQFPTIVRSLLQRIMSLK